MFHERWHTFELPFLYFDRLYYFKNKKVDGRIIFCLCSLKEGTLNCETLQFKSQFPRQVILCRVRYISTIWFDESLVRHLLSCVFSLKETNLLFSTNFCLLFRSYIMIILYIYPLNNKLSFAIFYFLNFSFLNMFSGWGVLWSCRNRCLYSCWICRFKSLWWSAIRWQPQSWLPCYGIDIFIHVHVVYFSLLLRKFLINALIGCACLLELFNSYW